MRLNLFLLAISFWAHSDSFAQTSNQTGIKVPPSITEYALKKHVYFLADDNLEGRATGSKGEQKASDYIQKQFAEIGLIPAGENNNYLQTFEVHAGKELGENNYIHLSNSNKDFTSAIVHIMSANGRITASLINANYGISAPDINYDDYSNLDVRNKIVLIKLSSPDGSTPHSKFADFAEERAKIKSATNHGAVGVIFYNMDSTYEEPEADYRRTTTAENIPVYFVGKNDAEKLLNYNGEVTISAELNNVIKTGHNVVGYLNNGASNTVVIGAHYDHLGFGEIEGSLYRGTPSIHNGADDNASGVGLIIELAEKLSYSPFKNNNYLFVAFSGEEMGLFGSKAFVNSGLIKNYSVNYMLNFDMVGRLDSAKTLIINGVGTSSAWSALNNIKIDGINIKTTESGIGPSDQTSFYLKDIPVLHFFTGSHNDYHKPGDDADKVNYKGIESILNYTYCLIDSLNDNNKINFIKTKEDNNENAPKFTVTMGVIPDYAYNGKGMRIDGVSDGKPAQKAGVLAGDIVIKMGDYEVVDMMSYMVALSKFKKSDFTSIILVRNNNEIQLQIQF